MTGFALRVGLLALVYVAVLGSLEPLDLLAGGVIGAAILRGLRAFVLPPATSGAWQVLRRVTAFPRFAGVVAWEIAKGTLEVSLVVLGRRELVAPGVVEVPIGDRSPAGVAVTSLATTLSPGAVLVDVDWDRRVMLYHLLDARDPDAVRRHQQQLYDHAQRAVFP